MFNYVQQGYSTSEEQNNPVTHTNFLGGRFSDTSTLNYKSFTLNFLSNGRLDGAGFGQGGETYGFNGYFNPLASLKSSIIGTVSRSDGEIPYIISGYFNPDYSVSLFLSYFNTRATTSAA